MRGLASGDASRARWHRASASISSLPVLGIGALSGAVSAGEGATGAASDGAARDSSHFPPRKDGQRRHSWRQAARTTTAARNTSRAQFGEAHCQKKKRKRKENGRKKKTCPLAGYGYASTLQHSAALSSAVPGPAHDILPHKNSRPRRHQGHGDGAATHRARYPLPAAFVSPPAPARAAEDVTCIVSDRGTGARSGLPTAGRIQKIVRIVAHRATLPVVLLDERILAPSAAGVSVRQPWPCSLTGRSRKSWMSAQSMSSASPAKAQTRHTRPSRDRSSDTMSAHVSQRSFVRQNARLLGPPYLHILGCGASARRPGARGS